MQTRTDEIAEKIYGSSTQTRCKDALLRLADAHADRLGRASAEGAQT